MRMGNLSESNATQEKWTIQGPSSMALGDMQSLTSAFVTSNSSRRGWKHGDFKFYRYRKVRKYSADFN